MSTVLVTSLWITRLIGPALVLALGALLVVSALNRHSSEKTEKQVEEPTEEPVS
jgi:cytochrome c-type biogenesis protein CcmH/NrfF